MKIGKFTTVVLSGSTQFKDEYLLVAQNLALSGYIVLHTNVYSHADGKELSDGDKALLADEHIAMMDIADMMYVIDKDGYIGESTKAEIAYFKSRHPYSLIAYYTKSEFVKKQE